MRTAKRAGRLVLPLLGVLVLVLVAAASAVYADALGVSPASQSVQQGQPAGYTLTVAPTGGFTGGVSLTASGLPSGATASFAPSTVTVSSSATSTSILTVTTASTTPVGSYTITISGSSGKQVNSTTAGLTVNPSQPVVNSTKNKSFTIGGDLSGQLAPGAPDRPLNLIISNPNNQSLAVTDLTVTVHHTSAGAACDPGNFTVAQYRGPYPLTVPASGTASLSQLGVPSSVWPQVRMLDLTKNQDACKNVTVTLAYSGSGQGT